VTGFLRGLRRAAALGAAFALLAGPAASAPRKKKRKAPEPTAVPRPNDPSRVTLTTTDGVSIAASWRPLPERPQAPAVLLVHDFSRERRDWEAVAADFTAAGFATLAIDLRAHGESAKKAGLATPLKLSPRLLSDPNGFPRDVEAACTWLRAHASRIGVVGLSLGANLAILATASRWADAAVSISANADKLSSLAGSRPRAARATLFLAAEDDPDRARSVRDLLAAAAEPKKALVYSGPAHNLSLFTAHPESKKAALAWLAERLRGETMSARETSMSAVPPAPTPTPGPTPPR
jgi:dienelactone hydrolase